MPRCDLDLLQDVELVLGNIHTKLEKDTTQVVHFRGKNDIL